MNSYTSVSASSHLLHLVLNAVKSVASTLELYHILEDKGHQVLPLLFKSCLLLCSICVCNAFFQKLIQLSMAEKIVDISLLEGHYYLLWVQIVCVDAAELANLDALLGKSACLFIEKRGLSTTLGLFRHKSHIYN